MLKNKQDDYVHSEAPFAIEVYEERLNKVRRQMESLDLDAIMVFTPAAQFYLTGYQSMNIDSYRALVIPMRESPFLILWQQEIAGAQLTTWLDSECLIGYPDNYYGISTTESLLKKLGLRNRRIGIEEDSSLSIKDYNELRRDFPAHYCDTSDLVRKVMSIKSKEEIECIKAAARMTEKGMKAAIDAIREGAIDSEVAKEAYNAMVGAGSEYFSYQPIVTSGMRSGIPHTTFNRVEINKGESVLLEMSGVFKRYHAPLMRSAFVGEPNDRVCEMHNGCKIALENILSKMAPGKTFDEIAKAGKEGISLINDPIIFHKTYGYSIGIGFPSTWADDKNLMILEGDQRKLEPGMVFHHTMSVRDPGKYGIALSETVLVTEEGCEVLTKLDRELPRK